VKKIEKVESIYPTRQALEAACPTAASQPYKDACDAVIAWHNPIALINTEMSILTKWVGNEELDFTKARPRSSQATWGFGLERRDNEGKKSCGTRREGM
jgi:mitogen-activated protein kinase kinase kinase